MRTIKSTSSFYIGFQKTDAFRPLYQAWEKMSINPATGQKRTRHCEAGKARRGNLPDLANALLEHPENRRDCHGAVAPRNDVVILGLSIRLLLFQPDEEHRDVGGADAGNSSGLTDGQGFNL